MHRNEYIVLALHRHDCWSLQVTKDKETAIDTCWGTPILERLYYTPYGRGSIEFNLFLIWPCLNRECGARVAVAISAIEDEIKLGKRHATMLSRRGTR